MIYIKVVGLDQFIVGRISRESTDKLANLFEVESDEINYQEYAYSISKLFIIDFSFNLSL